MKSLNYSQINLVPRFSALRSRDMADLSFEFLGRKIALPVLPSNMEAVINTEIARYLATSGHAYIMHRFGDTESFVKLANREEWPLISISVGVKEADRELLRQIVENNLRVDWICADIAHGHSILMRDMIEFIRRCLPRAKIIAGNVATPEAVNDLVKWGADAVKVGIAGGAACSTKVQTGFHVPMFSCDLNCAKAAADPSIWGAKDIPLIFDGGIRENGDIAKALVAGGGKPNLVMAGSLFAACIDAPGENVTAPVAKRMNGGVFPSVEQEVVAKRYHGSASALQKGHNSYVEGFEVDLPCNGRTYSELYREIRESLQSAISYAGGRDISAFAGVEWVEVS